MCTSLPRTGICIIFSPCANGVASGGIKVVGGCRTRPLDLDKVFF
jgi:hypothetical protein